MIIIILIYVCLFQVNISDLDPSKYELKYYPSENAEYVYDSDLHTDVFENEAIVEFKDEWFVPMMENIEKVLNENKINRNTVVHFGTSLGRVSLELAKTFKQVKFNEIYTFYLLI